MLGKNKNLAIFCPKIPAFTLSMILTFRSIKLKTAKTSPHFIEESNLHLTHNQRNREQAICTVISFSFVSQWKEQQHCYRFTILFDHYLNHTSFPSNIFALLSKTYWRAAGSN